MEMLMVQDEPYSGIIEVLDDNGDPQVLPDGELRMHLRKHYSTLEPPLIDCSEFLERETTRVLIEIPADVTVALPAILVGDVWAGDVRLASLQVTVSRSATLRSFS